MSSVLGVSVGAGAIRLAQPKDQLTPHLGEPPALTVQTTLVGSGELAETTAEIIATHPDLPATIAYRTNDQAQKLRAAMARRKLTRYELVPELNAALAWLQDTGQTRGFTCLAVYDLGASGLTVSVVELATRTVRHTEWTSDISGDYFDSLIREQQIASGRIEYPHDAGELAQLDAQCREAKEELSRSNAVALPSAQGLVLLTQENFESLIMLAVESSVRLTREVLDRTGNAIDGVLTLGGGARIRGLAPILEHRLGVPVLVPADPELVTTRGAALLARPTTSRETGRSHRVSTIDPIAPALTKRSVRRTGWQRMNVAAVAVTALIVVAMLGVMLSYGPDVLQRGSQSSKGTTSVRPHPTTTHTISATTSAPPSTEEPAQTPAPPPQNYDPGSVAPTTGPNTIVVPGLPPIVVPTIPPPNVLFPPPNR